MNELGPVRKRKILAAPQAEPLGVGEVAHVGGAGGASLHRYLGRIVVETDHGVQDLGHQFGRGVAPLNGRSGHAYAQRLRQDQDVVGSEPGVGQDAVGVDLAHDGQAELGLRIVDGVPAGDHEPGLGRDVLRAKEDLSQQVARQLLAVPPHQVEGQQRPTSHGVHVGYRVGSRHATPGPSVVDNRGDEVGRDHQGTLVIQPPHGSIVAGCDTDQQVGIGHGGQAAHDVRQLTGGELAASTGSVTELGQSTGLRHVVTPSQIAGGSLSRARVGAGSGGADDAAGPEVG